MPGSGIWTVESSGWLLMGGRGRHVSMKSGLMCVEEMRTGSRGVRPGTLLCLKRLCIPLCWFKLNVCC